MVDPGFPRGCQPRRGVNLLFDIIFPEKCMKMKKCTARGRASLTLPGSATGFNCDSYLDMGPADRTRY